jgi:hypothetical protein
MLDAAGYVKSRLPPAPITAEYATLQNGRREALLFVVEEESDPQRFSLHRLAHYCLDLSDLLKTDRIVPVVIFLRGGPRRRELVLGGDRHTFLSFRFLSCELATLPYQRFRESDNIVARINLPNMLVARENRVEAYASALRGLVGLERDPEKQLKYCAQPAAGRLASRHPERRRRAGRHPRLAALLRPPSAGPGEPRPDGCAARERPADPASCR